MHRSLLLCLLTVAFAAQTRPDPVPQAAFADPGIAPDGSDIALVSGGDIWTVPSAGGQARLLVSHAATESRPVYSPDKTRLAFVSTRRAMEMHPRPVDVEVKRPIGESYGPRDSQLDKAIEVLLAQLK